MLNRVKDHFSQLSKSKNFHFWLIGLSFSISIILHWHVFSLDLVSIHCWRQTETQTVINNFAWEDFNILNPRVNGRGNGDGVFRKEFPLMQWLFACFYKLLGNHIAISRILSLIISFGSIIGIYTLFHALFNSKTIATIGAWCFSFSPAFFYYSVCPMPDNFALFLSIWGLTSFMYFVQQQRTLHLLLASILFCLATLVKLPFILFYAIPLGFGLIAAGKGNKSMSIIIALPFILISIPFLVWYSAVIPTWKGNGITTGMLDNALPLSTLLHYLFSNLFSVLPELLINYGSVLLFLLGIFYVFKNKLKSKYAIPFILCNALLCGYVLFELNMIKDMHDYYFLPFMPFIFLLVAYGAKVLLEGNAKWNRLLLLLILLILPFTTYLRMQSRWNTLSPGFNKDLYAYKQELRDVTPQQELVVVGNDFSPFIFLYYIDKKGWFFDEDHLDGAELKTMINSGAKYLYTDSKVIQNKTELLPYFEAKIFEKGSICVYKLKP